MVVINDIMVFGCTPDKLLKIVSSDMQVVRLETSVQIAVSVSKGNFQILY